jgi:hypothetical protein
MSASYGRSSQARDEPLADRIGCVHHDDGNLRGGLFRGGMDLRAGCNKEVYVVAD